MENNHFYAFDEDSIVAINARPNSDTPAIVWHKLRKPTLQELIERESQIKYEMVEINSREEGMETEDDAANCRLWDKTILQIKGYKGADEWRDITEEEKAAMRPGHKSTAIRAMYAGTCEVEGDEDGVSIGPDTWTIRQEIGTVKGDPDYIVLHILREPTEAERSKYKRNASSTSYIKGAKKQRVTVRTNLRAYVELYDALVQGIEGGTAINKPWTEMTNSDLRQLFLHQVDPIWKRLVIQTFMSALEAQISD